MNVVAHVPLQNDLHITEYDAEGNVKLTTTGVSVTPPVAGYNFVDATGTGVERVQGIKCLELDVPTNGATATKAITDRSFFATLWSREDDAPFSYSNLNYVAGPR